MRPYVNLTQLQMESSRNHKLKGKLIIFFLKKNSFACWLLIVPYWQTRDRMFKSTNVWTNKLIYKQIHLMVLTKKCCLTTKANIKCKYSILKFVIHRYNFKFKLHKELEAMLQSQLWDCRKTWKKKNTFLYCQMRSTWCLFNVNISSLTQRAISTTASVLSSENFLLIADVALSYCRLDASFTA